MSPAILGWDIGGVNTKVTRLVAATDGPVIRSMCVPFELKHDSGGLTPTLTQAARAVGGAPTDLHAVTKVDLSHRWRLERCPCRSAQPTGRLRPLWWLDRSRPAFSSMSGPLRRISSRS